MIDHEEIAKTALVDEGGGSKKKVKKKRGRPPRNIDLKEVERLGGCGFIDEQIARIMKLPKSTFKHYKDKPEFTGAIKRGRDNSNEKVIGSLWKLCHGFMGPDGKYYPPNMSSIAMWLNNRMPEQWENKKVIEMPDVTKEMSGIAEAMKRRYNGGKGK